MANVLRVVHVIDDLGMGGAQRQLTELVKALPRHRISAHIISLSCEKNTYAEAIRASGIPLTCIEHRGTWSWTTLWTLWRTLRAVRPDVVQTWLFTADLYGRLAACLCRAEHFIRSLRHDGRQAWLARVPVIISAVRSVEPWKPAHYVWTDRLLRRITDAYTVNAQAIGRMIELREQVARERIHTIYNGVNLDVFDAASVNGAVRRRLAIPDHRPVIGTIGRLGPEKDHETLLRACALVLRDVPDAQVLVVGSGPLAPQLASLAQTLALDGQIHFLEAQSNIAEIIAALDVVVISSRYEGCCNVILEAMAMGKPVVATAVGGNPELVLDGQTGRLVPPRDPQRLAGAIADVLEDRVRARAMGASGRQRVVEHFSVARMVDNTVALYEGLLK